MAKKAHELRNMGLEELDLLVDSLRKEIYKLRSERFNKDKAEQRIHLISDKKIEIARALTVRCEKVRV